MAQAGVILVSGLTTPSRWVDAFIVEAYTDVGLTDKVAVATSKTDWDGTQNVQSDVISIEGVTAGNTYYLRAGTISPVTNVPTWIAATSVVATGISGNGGGGGDGGGTRFKWVVSVQRKPSGLAACPPNGGVFLRHIDTNLGASTVFDIDNVHCYIVQAVGSSATDVLVYDVNTGTYVGKLGTFPFWDVAGLNIKLVNDPTFGIWLAGISTLSGGSAWMAVRALVLSDAVTVPPPGFVTSNVATADPGGLLYNFGGWDVLGPTVWAQSGRVTTTEAYLTKFTLYQPTSSTVDIHNAITDLNATQGWIGVRGVLADSTDNTLILADITSGGTGAIVAKYDPTGPTVVTSRTDIGSLIGSNMGVDENWVWGNGNNAYKFSGHDLSTVQSYNLLPYTTATFYGPGSYDSTNNVLWIANGGGAGIGHQLVRLDLNNISSTGITVAVDSTPSANGNGPNLITFGGISVQMSPNAQFVIGNRGFFFDIVNTTATNTGPPTGEVLFAAPVDEYITFPATLPVASAWASVPPTGSVSFSIKRDGVQVGSVDFAAGSNFATFTFPNDVTYSPGVPGLRNGQILELDAPTPQDLTLCGFGMMITGTIGPAGIPAPPPPPPPPPPGTYAANIAAACAWFPSQQLSDGAIQYSSTKINPYFGNLAALGWLECGPDGVTAVKKWIQWYIAHLNATDIWTTGTGGTMYDYNISGGVTGTSLNTADSTDSYAATFLSVVYNYYIAVGADTAYIASIQTQLAKVGQAVLCTQQGDGLTWALPTYHIKYLEDNCEVYRGLSDLGTLFTTLSNPAASTYTTAATNCKTGILTLYLSGPAAWSPYKDNGGVTPAPNGSVWYPDSVTQLFPVINGVITAADSKAIAGYAFLNAHWANWPLMPWNDPPISDVFPWILVGYGASLMADYVNVNSFIGTINGLYMPSFNWPFYDAEGGWYIRMNTVMEGGSPPPPPGAIDMLTVVHMDPNLRSTHYVKGPNSIYTVVDTVNVPPGFKGMTWFIKGKNGYPWDGKPFDDNYAIYIWLTENVWTDPHTFKNFHYPVPMIPRFFTPGQETSAQVTDTNFDIYTSCGAHTTSGLGTKIRTTCSGPHNDIDFGGDVGQRPYYVGSYYYDYNPSTGLFHDLEQFYFCGANNSSPALGWVKWHHIKDGVVVNTSTFNQLLTGSTSLVFPCGLPAIP